MRETTLRIRVGLQPSARRISTRLPIGNGLKIAAKLLPPQKRTPGGAGRALVTTFGAVSARPGSIFLTPR
jgi:hypothetical protein